jgi:hypothetical protein
VDIGVVVVAFLAGCEAVLVPIFLVQCLGVAVVVEQVAANLHRRGADVGVVVVAVQILQSIGLLALGVASVWVAVLILVKRLVDPVF